MTILHTILILAVALLALFAESALPGVRHWLGAQVDLLPGLVVYAALNSGITTLCLVSVLGSLAFDSLSANTFGATLLPLFGVGFVVHARRDLILREQVFAQFIIGAIASAVVPALTLMLLATSGQKPLLGWGTLWQFIVMSVGGGLFTPLWFVLFGWLHRLLGYQPVTQSSFRPDREIRRGRN